MNAHDEVLLENASEAKSIDLTAECERLSAAFVAQHGREPSIEEELRLWDEAYWRVYG